MTAATAPWACPRCQRRFTRKNQRHACGAGEGDDVVRGRPPAVVAVFAALEVFARSLGPVELVTRDRSVLLRSVRVFADLVIMTDAVRVAVHLNRQVKDDLFFKIVADRRHVTHVTKLKTLAEFQRLKPLLKEAYQFSLRAA